MFSTVLPVLVACVASLVLTAAATAAARGRSWLSGLPVAAALLAAAVAWAMIYSLDWHSTDLKNRLAFAPLGAAILFAVLSGGEGRPAALVNGVIALVVAGAATRMLYGRRPDMLPLELNTLSLLIGAATGLFAWRIEATLQRIGPGFGRLIVGIATGAAAVALPAMGDIQLGIAAGSLAAALGLPILLVFWRGTSAGIGAAAACLLAPLLLVDFTQASLDKPALTVVPVAVLVGLALRSGEVARLPVLKDKPARAGWIAVVVCIALAGAAVGWAKLHGAPEEPMY